MQSYKLTTTICLVVSLIGIMHAMNHHVFNRLYNRLLNDADLLVKSIVDCVETVIFTFGMGRNKNEANKLIQVAEHYEILRCNARPLFNLFNKDIRRLMDFIQNLESIRLVVKFLYSYFRQSAINIIDHLRRVYELNSF